VSSGPGLSTKVSRGIAWAASAQAVIAVTDLVSMMVVYAIVPQGALGIAATAVTFYTMLDTAADLGVTSSLIQRDDHTPERVSTVFWFNMLISTGLFLVVLIGAPLYARFQGNSIIAWLFIAYGGKLIYQNVYAIPFAMLRKEMRFADIAFARVLAHVSESVVRIVFALTIDPVWCLTLASLTRAFVFGVVMQLRHPFLPRFVFRPREVVHYVRFGLRSGASQILYQFYTNVDYAVVHYYFGDVANGIYYAAYNIILEPVKTIANVVIDVAFPTFARLRSDHRALVDQFIKFARLNLIAVLPFVVLVFLVLPEYLRIFTPHDNWGPREIELCVQAARILCFVAVLRALGFIGPPLLDGIGHPERTLRYMVIASICVPAMYILGANVLGGHIGFFSVAVAWAVGYPLAFAVLCYLVVRAVDLPLGEYARAARGGSSAAASRGSSSATRQSSRCSTRATACA
jgi:O-antigen/teichoic acid export membrane protein